MNLLQKDIQVEEDIAQQLNENEGDQLEDLRQKESLLWVFWTTFVHEIFGMVLPDSCAVCYRYLNSNSFRWTMLNHFVSPAVWEPIFHTAAFDEKLRDWILPRYFQTFVAWFTLPWTDFFSSEMSEIIRPPLFVDVAAYRWPDVREQYAALVVSESDMVGKPGAVGRG